MGGRTFCEKKGVTALIGVVRRIEGGKEENARRMATDLLQRWNPDEQCDKAIVLILAVDDRAFWLARDPRVPVYAADLTKILNDQVGKRLQQK